MPPIVVKLHGAARPWLGNVVLYHDRSNAPALARRSEAAFHSASVTHFRKPAPISYSSRESVSHTTTRTVPFGFGIVDPTGRAWRTSLHDKAAMQLQAGHPT